MAKKVLKQLNNFPMAKILAEVYCYTALALHMYHSGKTPIDLNLKGQRTRLQVRIIRHSKHDPCVFWGQNVND